VVSGQHNEVQKDRAIHIIHHAFRLGGGKERCAVALAASLKELGRRVVVHTIKADAALANSLGVELDLLPFKEFPRKLQAFRFFRQIDRVRKNMDGLQIAFSRVRAQDIVVCGGTHRGYLARARKWMGPFDWLQIWMEQQSYRQARVLVAHSDLVAEDLTRHYAISPKKIHLLYPPLDERFTKQGEFPPRAQLRKKFECPEEKVVFLFPSKGHRNKGLYRILEAMRPFAGQVLLAVAGKPPGRSQPSFVTYLGYVEDMAAAYRAADFTILGSYYESFGLVGPESILCGTRLVFEQNVGCLPVVKPEFVFTFSVWDMASIREAVSGAITLARQNRHHIDQPLSALSYDPSPAAHARAVLNAAS